MASLGFSLLAALLLIPGILILKYAKAGVQETLGGVLVTIGVIFGLIALALWSLGA